MSRELNKTREELAALFLAALEEERLPWHQPWLNHGPGLGASVNAVTGKAYRGINALMLWVTYMKVENEEKPVMGMAM